MQSRDVHEDKKPAESHAAKKPERKTGLFGRFGKRRAHERNIKSFDAKDAPSKSSSGKHKTRGKRWSSDEKDTVLAEGEDAATAQSKDVGSATTKTETVEVSSLPPAWVLSETTHALHTVRSSSGVLTVTGEKEGLF